MHRDFFVHSIFVILLQVSSPLSFQNTLILSIIVAHMCHVARGDKADS